MHLQNKPSPVKRFRALGLLVWKEHWGLSLKARLLLLALTLGALLLIGSQAHAFLAVNHPLHASVLVVEGWIPVHTLQDVATEFASGRYRRILIARPIYQGADGIAYGQSSGEYFVFVLARAGVPKEAVDVVFFSGTTNDRTFHSALSVRKRLDELLENPGMLDVLTVGAHARRTRLLYQRAFGNTARIGVIAIDDGSYDAKRWWRSSEGVRDVLGETIAYLYARLFFAGP